MRKIDFKILPMLEKDLPKIAKLEKLYFSAPWSENTLLSALNNPNTYFATAKYDQNIIGYAGMYYACTEGYIYNIAVHHDFRNMKIGQHLIKNLETYAKNKNLDFLSLEVRESNRKAIRLYTTCGFEISGLRKNFYDDPQEDGIIMTKYIKMKK